MSPVTAAAAVVGATAGALGALLVEHGLRALLDPGPMGVDDWGQRLDGLPAHRCDGSCGRPSSAATTRHLTPVPSLYDGDPDTW